MKCKTINKVSSGTPHIVDVLNSKKIALVINTGGGNSETRINDAKALRRATLINKVPYCTNMSTAYACLKGIEALKIKKSAPTILNAANEIAVAAFLSNKIKYLSIPRLVEKTLNKASFSNINSIKDVIEIDKNSRQIATSMVLSGKY